MHELDGSEAGGQFVRSALSLSVLWNEPIRIENIRGNRSTPGLKHQHLAVVETMAAVCDGTVVGAELGAETIEFDPGREEVESSSEDDRIVDGLSGGTYTVDIETAGSVTLLFEALLPLATILDAPLSVTATGGTDVKWSPPVDYFRYVKLPTVRAHGLVAACEVGRRGFYPNGGGRLTLHLAPSELDPIDRGERGPIEGVRLYSTESASLADRDVATRQIEGALERLGSLDEFGDGHSAGGDDRAPAVAERHETTAASHCPGTAFVIRVDHGAGIAGFATLGERGTPAERVGEAAADAANRWLDGTAAVDRHMADQLLILLALAGGRLRIPTVTDHVTASCDLLRAFGVQPRLADDGEASIVSIDRGS